MKLSFEQSELQKRVNISMKAVSTRTTMPILECLLIDATGNEIKFITNDMELGIETVVNGTIYEKGSIAIEARTFSEIIRRLPDSLVTIETDANQMVRITCEKARFDLPGQASEEFAYLPAVERTDSVVITQFSLRQIINQTLFSVSANDNNKMMTGELFEIKNNKLRVVALDGHRIAIRNLDLGAACSDKRIIVPGKTLNEISRIVDGGLEDEVRIYFSDNHIIFEFDQTMVLSRLIDGEYFNIDQMLSGDYETKVTVNKQEFLSCIGRASLLIRESDRMPVILDITEDGMDLTIDTAVGSMDESLSIVMEGKDIRIGFNPKFLMDALKAIEDEAVSIYFTSALSPCFIRDLRETYNYLILPVNIAR